MRKGIEFQSLGAQTAGGGQRWMRQKTNYMHLHRARETKVRPVCDVRERATQIRSPCHASASL